MSVVIELFDRPDPCSLVVLIAILLVVGNLMTRNIPLARNWSERVAGAAFVGYCVYAIAEFEPTAASEFLDIVLRGLFAAGWSLGLARILSAMAVFVYEHTILRVRHARLKRAAREFEEQRERVQLQLMMARKALAAPAITTIVEEPRPKPMTVIEQARQERGDYEQRLETLKELKDVSGLDDELLQEFEANELERYIRRVTDVLGYRQ